MKVLLSWLREYVDVPYSVVELKERLPMLGLGVDAVDEFGDDAVFDLQIAANRGDLMSLLGVAREIAASARGRVTWPPTTLKEAPQPFGSAQGVPRAGDLATVEVLAPDLSPRYTATMILDVKVGPSPGWMAHRLEASGIRSINNVVDVTNYVMLETGQPMHAFDYDRLAGGRIVVRRAREGERLVTLDGVERVLDPQTLVIADAARAVGVAGVIGGAHSEIGPGTTRVLLEAASFAPASIRRTSKRLGVRTESSARFERGVDIAEIPAAAARAASLLQQTAGGRVLRGLVDLYPDPLRPRTVELRWASVTRLLGIEIPPDEGVAILTSLGFALQRVGETLHVGVPSHRRDVEREEDLVEEVARHYGYDRISEAMPLEITAAGSRVPAISAEQAVRDALIRAGLTEVLSISLTRPESLDLLRLPADHPWRSAARLTNPLVVDHTQMRTTLLPALLDIARVNVNRRVPDVQVFEIGRVFRPDDGRIAEPRRVGILMTGRAAEGMTWNTPEESVAITFYHLKGVAESMLAELRVDTVTFAAGSAPWLHPGRTAVLRVEGGPLGLLGELHPEIAGACDLPAATYVAEFDLDLLLAGADLRPQYRPLPRFPAVRRDLAVVVPETTPAHDVREAIVSMGGSLLEDVALFDAYAGPQIPTGRRSLAYALTFRASDRTLAADEVDAIVVSMKQGLVDRLHAQIRE